MLYEDKMPEEKALLIQKLRTGNPMHSWRRISEIVCELYPDEDQGLHGNQLHGQDLCRQAMETIYGKDVRDLPDEIRNKWDS